MYNCTSTSLLCEREGSHNKRTIFTSNVFFNKFYSYYDTDQDLPYNKLRPNSWNDLTSYYVNSPLFFDLSQLIKSHKALYKNYSEYRKKSTFPLYFDLSLILKSRGKHSQRNKNPFLQEMNLLVSQPSIDYTTRKEILTALKYDYETYYTENSNRFLKFSLENTDYSYFQPYKFRGSKSYQKHVLWRLNHLSFNNTLNPYFMTLTVDFKRFNNIKSGSQSMSKSWNKLMTRIRQLDKDVQFLRVSEIQLKNTINVHFHILLYSSLSYDTLNNLLLKYNLSGYQNDLKDLKFEYEKRNNTECLNPDVLTQYVKSYILKYIKKGISTDDPLNNLNLIVLMALNSRSFSVSRNLKVQLETPETSLTPVDFSSNKTTLKVPFKKSNHKYFVSLLKKPLFFIVPKPFFSLSAHKKSFLDFHKNISNGNLKFHFDGIFYGFEFPIPIYENILYSASTLNFKGYNGFLEYELNGLHVNYWERKINKLPGLKV